MAHSQLIGCNELQSLLGNDELRVIDCRFDLRNPDAGRAAYLESHIPGAVYAHLDDDLAGPVTASSGRHPLPDSRQFALTLGRMGVASENRIVVYDAGNGAIAARAWWLLRWIGHTHVQLLDGGFGAWLAGSGETSSGQESVTQQHFEPDPNDTMIVTTDELLEAGNGVGKLNLVDARDAVRFRGEQEPIDSVAGHIPGARNLPLGDTVRGDGRLKGVDELRAIWSTVLGTGNDASWIATCGSGVTACHLALSAMHAGLCEPRVYVGSWSEWIRDPERPVGKGP